jgi:hypothetical protein
MSLCTRRRDVLVALVVALLAATVGVLLWRLRADDGPAPDAPADADDEPAIATRLSRWRPARATTTASRAAGYVWAAPMTAAGLLLAALSGVAPQVRGGALLFVGVRGLPRRMLRWRGFTAATLGHVILAVEPPSPALLRHELVHVRQAERLGPAFPLVYLWGLVIYGYRRNPLERAAYGTAIDRDPAT